MWRNYSPKTFLRQSPNSILKEYFTSKNLLTDIDFDDNIVKIEAAYTKNRQKAEIPLRIDTALLLKDFTFGKLQEQFGTEQNKGDIKSLQTSDL